MNDDLKMFIQFDKKDEDQRTVSGYATTEALDSQGEIVEKDAVSKALSGYLGDYDEKTGKYKYGGLREMHQLSAVGKTMKAMIDDKGLYIEGKVVDDNAWKKVKEGVYTGFSIGGKIIKQIENRIKDLRLSEISLVDRPANPDAVFEMIKIDKKGKVTDMQKMPMLTDTVEAPHHEEYPGEEVMVAGEIIDMARNIRMLLCRFEEQGKSTDELNRALDALKALAIKCLSEQDKVKFERVLYGIDFKELDKTKLPVKEKKNKILKVEEINVTKFINMTWTDGYFQNLKKVLG